MVAAVPAPGVPETRGPWHVWTRPLPRWYARSMAPQEDPDLIREALARKERVSMPPIVVDGTRLNVILDPNLPVGTVRVENMRVEDEKGPEMPLPPRHVQAAFIDQACGVVPRPPSERGWYPIGEVASGPLAGSIAFLGPASAVLDSPETDATFENEVRPS